MLVMWIVTSHVIMIIVYKYMMTEFSSLCDTVRRVLRYKTERSDTFFDTFIEPVMNVGTD